MAASSCNSPSRAICGASSFASATASITLSRSALATVEPCVEWESMATAGSVPMSVLHERPELTAMCASFSASGWISSPQSLKRNVPFCPKSQFGTTMTKNELTSFTPGAVLRICSAARSTSEVAWQAPHTMPSACPSFTIMVPKYSTSSTRPSAFSSVIPLARRNSKRAAANASRSGAVRGSMMRAPSSA